VLFLFLRSFVELDLLGGFGLNALLVPAGWLYARSARRRITSFVSRPQSTGSGAIEPGIASWSAA
jgi:hypothetical protein